MSTSLPACFLISVLHASIHFRPPFCHGMDSSTGSNAKPKARPTNSYPVFQLPADDQYEEGRNQLARLKVDSENPRYGQCWTSAIQQVHDGCKHLTDNEQSRLALIFTNCHLQKAQIQPYDCDENEDISNCLSRIRNDIIAFNAYTEFFTHTQNICFFLQNQIWHERTEHTVSRLATSSENVVEQLETTSELQDKMMQRQSQSLSNQEAIMKNEEYLRMVLHQSSEDLQKVFEDMKLSTKEQKQLFEETFKRVSNVQKVILGEFTSFHTLLFYVLASAVAYMLTSTARSSGARLWIFVILFFNVVVERLIFYYSTDDQDLLYYRMWMSRKVFGFFATVLWIWHIYRYKDYNKLNNELLLKIEQETSELRRDFKFFSTTSHTSVPAIQEPSLNRLPSSSSSRTMVPTITSNSSLYHPVGYTEVDSCPNSPAGFGGYSDSHGETIQLDYTYIPSDDSDSDDTTVSYQTASQSRRSSSSFLEGSQIINLSRISELIADTSTSLISGTKKQNYKTHGSASRYNLRSRSKNRNQNPTLEYETPEMFTKILEMRHRLLQEGKRQLNEQPVQNTWTYEPGQ